VCVEFVKRLGEAYPNLNLQAFKDKWPETPAEASEGPVMVTGGLYELNAQGETVDPLSRLRLVGFDLEVLAARSTKREDMYQIVSLSGSGATAVVTVMPFGGQASSPHVDVNVNVFLQEWVKVESKDRAELHAGWPSNQTSRTEAFATVTNKGGILAAVGALSRIFADHSFHEALDIWTKPRRKVLAHRLSGTFA
jgi:hypothetical protein